MSTKEWTNPYRGGLGEGDKGSENARETDKERTIITTISLSFVG